MAIKNTGIYRIESLHKNGASTPVSSWKLPHLTTSYNFSQSSELPGRKEVVEAPSICPELQDHLANRSKDIPESPIKSNKLAMFSFNAH